jgi:C4-dicarboxylate-specific signal transduction histidine kinase
MIFEPILIVFPGARFKVGFYASRFFTIAASTVVFAVLLWESGMLHRRLAQAAARLEHERENKLLTVDTAVSSIAHELRQPLAAASANADAALLLLNQHSPNIEEARDAMQAIVQDVCAFNDVLSGIRSMFRDKSQGDATSDPNDVVRRALRIAQWEATQSDITIDSALEPCLPMAACNAAQLLQVLLNLMQNAIEAMTHTSRRQLRIRTWTRDQDFIAISVEDTGPGVDPKKLNAIFDGFVTTKPEGMGLGLTICREIARRNGATINVKSYTDGGVFEVALPIAKRAVEVSK